MNLKGKSLTHSYQLGKHLNIAFFNYITVVPVDQHIDKVSLGSYLSFTIIKNVRGCCSDMKLLTYLHNTLLNFEFFIEPPAQILILCNIPADISHWKSRFHRHRLNIRAK